MTPIFIQLQYQANAAIDAFVAKLATSAALDEHISQEQLIQIHINTHRLLFRYFKLLISQSKLSVKQTLSRCKNLRDNVNIPLKAVSITVYIYSFSECHISTCCFGLQFSVNV